jgi:para-nitrobenzyl esterase
MKLARQTVCFFLTLVGVLLFWNVIEARAQMSKVRPDPLMEKAELSSMNMGIAGSPTGSPVMTEDGPVRGTNVFGVSGYLGIPYAAPPVGKLRWMPPQPHGMFNGVFDANTFGNFCTQPSGAGATTGAEDCLTLNVFTPTQIRAPLPVMVWIHGGALVTGGSFLYDPSQLVTQGNLIVVTINYRLGYLGFFAHPAIDAEGHLNGNYGLMDQQFALQWVQRNIAAFGGNPDRVTIFGESAGGQSVYSNLASPTAKALFQGAIAESGAYVEFQDYFDLIVSLATGETTGTSSVPSGEAIASSVGCGSQRAGCLRAVPASTLALAEPGTIYPFVDGTILTQTPTAAFTSGQFNQVPVISGGNHDEWRIFVADQYDFAGNPLLTPTQYQDATVALYGPILGPIVYGIVYPLASYPSPGIALGASGTDWIFACPERNSVRLLAQNVTTYAYEFNDENAPDLFAPPATFPLGAYHGSELQYLFNLNERFTGTNPFTRQQQALSNSMINYWTSFARNANPNSAGQPMWSQVDRRLGISERGGSFLVWLRCPQPRGRLRYKAAHRPRHGFATRPCGAAPAGAQRRPR